MDQTEARYLITLAYRMAFDRAPAEQEYAWFLPGLLNGSVSAAGFLEQCVASREYAIRRGVSSIFPNGHYHSPVVDPRTVRGYIERERGLSFEDIPGLSLDVSAMRALWLKHLDFTRTCPFTSEPNGTDRYRFGDAPFPEGDGITLRMMLAECRPRRVIEIGSGFSTACMLDSADHLGLGDLRLTCIEPEPERLRSLLRSGDTSRVTIMDCPVQQVNATVIDQLQPNDILFIDSTHVMKTGSDVHFEFFHLLPRVKPGVVVHFHDIGVPFEYPDKWIFEDNHSWNETYVLRAFLMYNAQFAVLYWNSLLWSVFPAQMTAEFPLRSGNPGGSIWIRRIGP